MRGSDVQEWRDEPPFMFMFMYATAPPNGRAGVGVEDRKPASAPALAFGCVLILEAEIVPDDGRTGCGVRGTGATGVGGWGWG